jgi:hypothetical protein
MPKRAKFSKFKIRFDEKAIKAAIVERRRVRTVAPDPGKLALIWPAWNSFPAKTDAQHRYHALIGDLPLSAAQKKKFGYLPFAPAEYESAFLAVFRWVDLKDYSYTTSRLHRKLVKNQLALKESDRQAEGRIAMCRVTKELAITNPGLLSKAAPLLEDIRILEQRYSAYKTARADALRVVLEILCRIPGVRKGVTLPSHDQAVGLPHPPEDVPNHLYIARLDALDICSQERLKHFMQNGFTKLDHRQRQEFYKVGLIGRSGKDSHTALRVWLLDNVPVFQRFDWRWPDIHTVASKLGLLEPENADHQNLAKWASRNRVSCAMNLGVGRQYKEQLAAIESSMPLLSPRPSFSKILTGHAN